jgi:hypothetical protein
MREKLFDSKSTKDKKMMRQSGGQTIANTSSLNGAKYTRLQNNFDSPHKNQESEIGINVDENVQQQQFIIKSQDETLNKLRDSVGTLKSISRHIGTEVDEHAVYDSFINLSIKFSNLYFKFTFDICIECSTNSEMKLRLQTHDWIQLSKKYREFCICLTVIIINENTCKVL